MEQVLRVLADTKLDPKALKLEVTESVLMDDANTAVTVLEQLRSQGIGVHLDDFGTGSSSLSYLHTLPLDVIKIDRAFIRDLATDPSYATTIKAISTLAQARKMRVVAEGVETPEHVAQLQSMGCDLGQGYYYAKPLDPDAAMALLQQGGKWAKAG